MSLLRRVERPTPPEDDNPRSTPPQPGSPIRELWHHRATSKLLCSALTRDQRFLVAGSLAGEVLFFDLAGRLLWTGQVEGGVNRIALAEQAECFLTGTVGSGHHAQLWHFSGRLLHTFETDGSPWGIAITPDASLIAVGSLDTHLYLFDRDGQLIVKHPVQSPIRHVSVTSDGDTVLVSTEDQRVCAFDRHGQERWTFTTGGSVWAGTRLAEEARCLVAGSNDGCVYALDFGGNEIWRFDTGGAVNNLAVTPDGNTCAVVGKANTAYLLNSQGNVLWEYQTDEQIYGLALSPDGRFMLIGTNDNLLYLVDHAQQHRVWQQKFGGRIYATALAPTGRFFAAACADQHTYVFHNSTVHDQAPELFGPDNPLLMRWIVRQVRDDYAVSPHLGLVRWFSEFERSLRSHQFDVCRALLREVHEENSLGLSEGEQQYTRSLEGTYWLFRGIAFHRSGYYPEARECYEQSRAIHEATHNQDGVGQVLAALSSLPEMADDEAAEDSPVQADTQKLLDEIAARPRVLGTSEKALEHRLARVPADEQFRIVVLARQSGYIAPLVLALKAEERIVRAAASAALSLLQPGPDDDVLEQMLTSGQSFVRWQALRILRHRAHTNPDGFAPTRERLWTAIVPTEPFTQADTLVRREEALLAKEAGQEADTPWLIARLSDPDPDVQIAAIEALGAVGNRRALPELARVQNQVGFLGVSTKAVAEEAINAVQSRYPLPLLQKVYLCRDNPLQQGMVQQTSLFLTDTDVVYGIVTIDHVPPGTRVTAQWRHQGTTLQEETSVIGEAPDPSMAEVRETNIVPEGPARRFGSPFGEDDDDERPARSPFGRPAPTPSDRPGARPLFGSGAPSPFGGDRPRSPLFGARPGSSSDPNENVEPPSSSPFRQAPEVESYDDEEAEIPAFLRNRMRPPASPSGAEEPEESNLLRRLLAARRTPPPAPAPPRSPFGGFRPGTPAPAPRAPGAPPSPFGRDRADPMPPWLARMRDDPQRDRPSAARPGGLFGGLGVARRSPTARRVVVSLPRPETGWDHELYHLEIAIDGESRGKTEFRVIEAPALIGLETGLAGSAAEKDFGKTHVFLSSSRYIDCLAYLKEAPVNTRVVGRLYNTVSGALLGESVAITLKQGRQSILLSWENPGWRAGHYRIAVSVTPGNELITEIELVDQLHIGHLVLCHAIDNQNGPIGTEWPFYAGDTCYCVLELEDPPPGVDVQAEWYRKDERSASAKPLAYLTTPGGQQHAVFNLSGEYGLLRPGYYSVVIRGSHVARQERSVEVFPHPPLRRLGQTAQRVMDRVSPTTRNLLLTGLGAAGVIFVLALAALLLEAGVQVILDRRDLTRDAMLTLGHAVGHPTPLWGLAWLAFAAGYGTLYTRQVKGLASTVEKGTYGPANLLLVFAASTLTWTMLGTIALGLGRLWPGTWWGFFKSLHWLAPGVVALAPLIGAAFTYGMQRRNENEPFYWAVGQTALLLAGLALIGYAGAFVVGFGSGLVGAIVGGLLDAGGTNNNLGRALLIGGTNLGFIAAPLAAGAYLYRAPLQAGWKAWIEQEKTIAYEPYTPLEWLLDRTRIPLKRAECAALVPPSVRVLAGWGLAVNVWAVLFDPVTMPILKWLYNLQDHPALSTLHLSLALGLLTIWPGLVYEAHRLILVPGLDDHDARLARYFSAGVGLAPAVALGFVVWLSHTPLGREYPAAISMFWVNRIAEIVVLLLGVGYTALLSPQFKGWLRELSPGRRAVGLAILLAAALLPVWMGAILLMMILGAVATSIYALNGSP